MADHSLHSRNIKMLHKYNACASLVPWNQSESESFMNLPLFSAVTADDDIRHVCIRALSAVGRAQCLVSQGYGFEPDLFHKAYYMPFKLRWLFEMKLRIFACICHIPLVCKRCFLCIEVLSYALDMSVACTV